MVKLVLKGGEIFDGTGAAGFKGDVLVEDGIICAVCPDGELEIDDNARVIDVSGLTVSPSSTAPRTAISTTSSFENVVPTAKLRNENIQSSTTVKRIWESPRLTVGATRRL